MERERTDTVVQNVESACTACTDCWEGPREVSECHNRCWLGVTIWTTKIPFLVMNVFYLQRLLYPCIKCIFSSYPQRSHSTFGVNTAYSLTSHSILVVTALYPQRPHSILVVDVLYPQRPHSILVVNSKITFRSYGECTLSTKIIFHSCGQCTLLTKITFYLCGEWKYHIPSLRWLHFTHKHLFASLWWMPLIRWRRMTI